jgi:hypothetical protein
MIVLNANFMSTEDHCGSGLAREGGFLATNRFGV